jgi:hypothetical protein
MLEAQLREAFERFASSSIPPFSRERELVSVFVFSHLVATTAPGRSIATAGQIGIEVAVPQRRDLPNPRHDPDVCKDIVIWPKAGMTCWDEEGRAVHLPRAVIEWKSINRKDRPDTARRKREKDHLGDVEWLRSLVNRSPHSEGYAVLVDLSCVPASISVQRVAAGVESPDWFVASLHA